MSDIITVQLRFGVDTALGLYQDTLSFTEDEWARRDQAAVDAAKQTLADAWVTFRSVQIAEEDALRTAEGKQAKIAEIDVKIADLAAARAQLEAQLADAEVKP